MGDRKQKKASTRQRLKKVAKVAFLQQGIEATSTRYITQQADVAVGTLFAHFPDKLSLVKDIFFDEMDIALRTATQNQQECDSPVEYLIQMAQVLFEFYDQFTEFSQLVLFDSLSKGGFHQQQMSVVMEGMEQRFIKVGVDANTAHIFAENMMANYWFVVLEAAPKGVLGSVALAQLKRLNLPFEVSYKNALK
ncbi:TetR/AcrR family transcriptional regulator [Marinomonas epiphytica]